MTISRKSAYSLLISVVLFAVIMVLAYTGLFDLVESRFYNPSVSRALIRETARAAEATRRFLSDTQNRCAASLDEAAVRRSFLPGQNDTDMAERAKIYGELLNSVEGLLSVRFVDPGGTRIHFSTGPGPGHEELSAAWRNGADNSGILSIEDLLVQSRGDVKVTLDSLRDCVHFSFPFYDSENVYHGTALFTVSLRALAGKLAGEGRLKAGERLTVISAPPGIVSGGPESLKKEIAGAVSAIWELGLLSLTPLESALSGPGLVLVSARTSQGIFYGRIIDESVFIFPRPLKALLLLAAFLTLYLGAFFLFNFRQDPVLVIQNRLKDLQISLIEQFYERKNETDWSLWNMELEQRRGGVRAEIKRGIKFGMGGCSEEDADYLIDKSWDELLSLFRAQFEAGPGIDEEQLRRVLKNALRTLPLAVPPPEITARPSRETTEPGEIFPVEAEHTEESLSASEFSPPADRAGEENGAFNEPGDDAEPAAAPPVSPPLKTGGLLAAAARVRLQEPEVTMASTDTEEIEELEELEEADESGNDGEAAILEELEEEDPSPSPSPARNIDELASMIEFSPDFVSGEEENPAPAQPNLEIVSPFSSMLSSLSESNPAAAPTPEEPRAAILERDGLPYISSGAGAGDPKTGETLDLNFKKLVDEVTRSGE